MSLCNLAALRSSQPLPQRGAGGAGPMQGGIMQGGAGMTGGGMGSGMGAGMVGGMGASGEDVSARKIFIRGLSW